MWKTIVNFLPKVAEPKRTLTFQEKLTWTGLILIAYFILAEVPLWGISPNAVDYFESLRAVLAGRFDSIITLGIGPIVMGSIVLQLLMGAGVLKFDTSTNEGRKTYQSAQKLMVLLFTILEGGLLIVSGQVPPNPAMGSIVVPALMIQIMLGGFLIVLMDEVVSKWGFGSGVSLFIAAGVSQQIFVGSLNWIPAHAGEAIPGAIPYAISAISQGTPFIDVLVRGTNAGDLLAMFSTVIVLVVSIYAAAMKIEIPIAYGGFKGISRKYPLPFMYASNMPVIFTAALMANLQIWVGLLEKSSIVSTHTAQTFLFYVLPHHDFADKVILQLAKGGVIGASDIGAAFVYTIIMIIGSIIFSILWVEMSNMNAESLAGKLSASGLQIPGFRSDTRVMQKILERYIPSMTILGGAFVGLLAALATLTGAFGGGTGVLLTAGIVYKLYEDVAGSQLMDAHPLMKKLMGEGKIAF